MADTKFSTFDANLCHATSNEYNFKFGVNNTIKQDYGLNSTRYLGVMRFNNIDTNILKFGDIIDINLLITLAPDRREYDRDTVDIAIHEFIDNTGYRFGTLDDIYLYNYAPRGTIRLKSHTFDQGISLKSVNENLFTFFRDQLRSGQTQFVVAQNPENYPRPSQHGGNYAEITSIQMGITYKLRNTPITLQYSYNGKKLYGESGSEYATCNVTISDDLISDTIVNDSQSEFTAYNGDKFYILSNDSKVSVRVVPENMIVSKTSNIKNRTFSSADIIDIDLRKKYTINVKYDSSSLRNATFHQVYNEPWNAFSKSFVVSPTKPAVQMDDKIIILHYVNSDSEYKETTERAHAEKQYTFSHWEDTSKTDVTKRLTENYKPNSDCTLTAIYTEKIYVSCVPINSPEDRKGYQFLGWYREEEPNKLIKDESITLKADEKELHLYARYAPLGVVEIIDKESETKKLFAPKIANKDGNPKDCNAYIYHIDPDTHVGRWKLVNKK